MKCLNCGKELTDKFEFEIVDWKGNPTPGRHNVGYDCTCGYSSYENYLEITPPQIESMEDFTEAIKNYGGTIVDSLRFLKYKI